jgi:hypothetical protein
MTPRQPLMASARSASQKPDNLLLIMKAGRVYKQAL